MRANYVSYLAASESQPDWLFWECNDILEKNWNSERKDKVIFLEYAALPPGDVVFIRGTSDIFRFHFKSDDPDDRLNIIFYNKNGKIIICYCSGKGDITKLDNGERITIPISSAS